MSNDHSKKYFSESSVKVGEYERAKKSTYFKMKQRRSSATKHPHTSLESTHNLPAGPTSKSELSNDFIHMLKSSGLEDGTNQQHSTEFKFNFEIGAQERPVEEKLHSDLSIGTTRYNSSQLKPLKYKASDNTFRFNFNT